MSHNKERHEKICLNCGAAIHGRYCHVCGQENTDPKESFWHLVTHFIHDITHFDGKFFSTLKYLLFKPGFLPSEYGKGKRTSYLHPVRMYVFTSAIFFLYFLSIYIPATSRKEKSKDPEKMVLAKEVAINTLLKEEDDTINRNYLLALNKRYDTALAILDTMGNSEEIDIKRKVDSQLVASGIDTSKIRAKVYTPGATFSRSVFRKKHGSRNGFTSDLPDTIQTYEQYTAWQDSMPRNKRDGWFKKTIYAKYLSLGEKYHHSFDEFMEAYTEKFLHSIPQMFFFFLPIFAFILFLLYISNKQLYYINHAVFSLYLYIAMFIFAFLRLVIGQLSQMPYLHWLSWVGLLVTLYALFYPYASMHYYYRQGWGKTFIKYFFLWGASSFFIVLLLVIFMFVVVFKV